MNNILVEIRAAEGGDHSKRIILSQLDIYERFCQKNGLWINLLEVTPSFILFKVSGSNAHFLFKGESGYHKWQQKSGDRVHTSTITVAILPIPNQTEIKIQNSDLDIVACRGSGPGGQNRNKVNSAIQIKHKPTGITVHSEAERSQFQNKELALEVLRTRLQEYHDNKVSGNINYLRNKQISLLNTKRRTVAFQRNFVEDHITGKTWQISDYLKGNL